MKCSFKRGIYPDQAHQRNKKQTKEKTTAVGKKETMRET